MYREVIDKQIASAMKNGDHLSLSMWRSLKNEFIKFRTSGTNEELSDEKEYTLIKKMVQQRKDSIEKYVSAGRNSLAEAEEKELKFLQALLPNEPTIDEVSQAIREFADTKDIKLTMRDMRDVMNYVKSKFPTADGAMISKLFRENYI